MSTPVNNETRVETTRRHAKRGWFEKQPDTAKAAIITGVFSVVVALIAGTVGLATGVFGSKNEARPTSTWATSIGSPTSAEVDTPAATQSTDAAPEPSAGDADGADRLHGRTFNENYQIDLDSTRQNWDLSRSWKSGSDLGFEYISIKTIKIQGEASRARATPNIDDCNNSTVRFRYGIEDEDFAAGNAFCVITTDNKWVWVKIVRFDLDAENKNITLDIVPLGKVQ
ncbi:hypothetical protein [Actinoplanes sp. NPDC026619]|uniref:hypothetical protein n=1 Tax=Actinoplanes sp. NPDC026619 TaxID=3155798 RepID=UPI00340FF3D7